MLRFKSYLAEQELLIESSTADATNAEKAICYAYNRWEWPGGKETERNDHETAMSLAGLKDYDKFSKLVKDVGKLTAKDAKDLGGWGKYLSHSGSTTAASNHYASDYGYTAGDTTSKSDFVSTDDDTWNISLKKAGDKGAGAQIMSSKGGEGQGVFRAGIEHFEAVSKTTIDVKVKTALDSFWKELNDTVNNELVIQVGGGKKDLKNWYIDPKSKNPSIQKSLNPNIQKTNQKSKKTKSKNKNQKIR